MTPEEINLVQTSLRLLAPVADLASALFFARLFEIDPPLRGLIASDFTAQQQRVLAILSRVTAALGDSGAMSAAVRSLEPHRCPLADHHLVSISTALLWTLDQILGPSFTPETRAAWVKAHGLFTAVFRAERAAAAPA